MSLVLTLWHGSVGVVLPALWGYKAGGEAIRESIRAPGGTYHKWDHGFFKGFDVPCDFMTESAAAVVNSWWQSRALCRFEIASGSASEVWSVQIVNNDSPFGQRRVPWLDRYKGDVKLATY